ncbi:hypothetical protein [Nonomuraea longicatena]
MLRLTLTAVFVVFVLSGPTRVFRPGCPVLLGALTCAAVVMIARKIYLARRPASHNQP